MNSITEPNADGLARTEAAEGPAEGLRGECTAWEYLSHLGVIRFSGADAVGFLQGQLSNDTNRLTAGTPVLAALSTAQGRVVTVLHLLPHSTGVLAIVPRELASPTIERLRKYVLRAKVHIENLSEHFPVIGCTPNGAAPGGGVSPPAAATQPPGESAPRPFELLAGRRYVEQGGIGFARVGAEADRCWAVGDSQSLLQMGLAHPLTAPAGTAWRLADVRAGMPQIYASTSEMFVAQMLNLDLIDGISFTKGCFTGQEIIARTQHLGRIKRRLFRLRLPAGPWSIGQAIRLTDGRSGRLTEVVRAGDGYEALAVLTVEREIAEAEAPGPHALESHSAPAETAADLLALPYAVEARGSATSRPTAP